MRRDEISFIAHGDYSWIKVKSYKEEDLKNPEVEWKYAYEELANHHKKETEFLIAKCKELAKQLLENDRLI